MKRLHFALLTLLFLLLPLQAWGAATDLGIRNTKAGETCAQVFANPVQGASWCFDRDANVLKAWNGLAWLSSGSTVYQADLYPGADMAIKINAAIAACPATGCVIDARGFTGAQSTATTIAITKPLHLIFGAVTLTSSAVPIIDLTVTGPPTATEKVWIQGSGIGVTNILATGNGADGIKALYGSPTLGVAGVDLAISDLTLKGDRPTTNHTRHGIYLQGAVTPTARIRNLDVKNWGVDGLRLDECIDGRADHIISQTNTGDGFHILRGNILLMSAVTAYANAGDGFDIEGGPVGDNGKLVLGPYRSESNHGAGVKIGQRRNIDVNHGWIEGNWSHGIWLAGTAGSDVEDGEITHNFVAPGISTVAGSHGIFLDEATQVHVEHNYVDDFNLLGAGSENIVADASSSKNIIRWNYRSVGLVAALDTGTDNVNFNEVVAGGLNVANGKNILYADGVDADAAFMGTTADGDDHQTIYIAGGGAVSNTRGAFIGVSGNEITGGGYHGIIQIAAGNSGEGGLHSDEIRMSAGNVDVALIKAGDYRVVPAQLTDPVSAGVTVSSNGSLTHGVYKAVVSYTQCITAAVDCDLTVVVLPAKTFLVRVLADLTVPYVCAGTCTTATLTGTLGRTAGASEWLASFDADAAAALFGDADAELGTEMTAAARIANGALIPGVLGAWAATTNVVYRLHSATGNLGTGTASNLNAGSVTFYLETSRMP